MLTIPFYYVYNKPSCIESINFGILFSNIFLDKYLILETVYTAKNVL